MRSIRSTGHWLVLLGVLAAMFAAAVEGQVGRAAIGGAIVASTGVLVVLSAPLLYATRASGAPIASRATRVGVPVGLLIAGGAVAAVVVEGRAGPATLITIVVLGVGALVVMSAALLYERDDGVPLLPATYRVGMPLLALVGPALGAVVIVEGHVGPATGAAIGLVVLAVAASAGLSIDTPAWPRRRMRSRRVRMRITVASLVIAGIAALIAFEGGIGPAVLAVVAGLALLPLVRRALPVRHRSDRGAMAPPTRVRVAVLFVAVFALGLGALAASLDTSSSEIAIAAEDAELGAPAAEAAPAGEAAVDPGPVGRGAMGDAGGSGVLGRWDTLGDPFADDACASGGPFEVEDAPSATRTPLDRFTRVVMEGELDEAREHALAHPTVVDAEAAGYRQATDTLPCVGTAYVRWDITADDLGGVDAAFEPGQPEVLRYAGTAPDAPIVGVGYLVVGEAPPDGFSGDHDQWRNLVGTCVTEGLITSVKTAQEGCAAETQRWLAGHDLWTIHAWVAPGWQNPLGVFALGHARLG